MRLIRLLAVCAVWWLITAAVAGAQVSPLNLSPGFPTSLDDAYPVNTDHLMVQPAVRYDKTDSGSGRVRQTIDARWGIGHGVELFVGGTPIRGPLEPGTLDDPRAVRAGLLYRFTRQPGPSDPLPSLAVRTTVQVPFSGPQKDPSLRSELLASWDLSNLLWLHVNGGLQVAPGGQPGLQAPGRNSVWYGRAGLVKAITYDLGLVVSATYSQDYTQAGGNLLTPEIGFTYALASEWILTFGAGHDFGSSDTKASIRGNVGISWVW